MIRNLILAIALILPLTLSSAVLAQETDELLLKTGATLKGKVTEEEKEYIIKTDKLTTRIPKDMVQKANLTLDTRIEYQKKLKEKKDALVVEFEKKSAEVEKTSTAQWLSLAKWCQENDLDNQRRECLKKVIELDTNNEFARKELGYTWLEGQWVTEEVFMLKTGKVRSKDGWITKEKAAELKALEEKKKQHAKTETELKRLVYKMASPDKKKRDKAYEEVVAFGNKNGIKNIETAAAKVLGMYDKYWDDFGKISSADGMVRLDIYNLSWSNFRLQSINTRVLFDDNVSQPYSTVTIELPVGDIIQYKGSVVVPAGPAAPGK